MICCETAKQWAHNVVLKWLQLFIYDGLIQYHIDVSTAIPHTGALAYMIGK
jgi:hypothetical protein